MISFSYLEQRKNNKGFTLVELIVVLVILAVLAAILIPTLLGYIDKAKSSSIISDASAVREASTGAFAEMYGKGEGSTTWKYSNGADSKDLLINPTKPGEKSVCDKVLELAGVENSKCVFLWSGYQVTQEETGPSDKSVSIDSLYYVEKDSTSNTYKVATYSKGAWSTLTFTDSSALESDFLKFKPENGFKDSYTLRNKTGKKMK